MNREKENEAIHSEIPRIIIHLKNSFVQNKCSRWIVKNIRKSSFFTILSFAYTKFLLRELIIFRHGSFYLRLKKLYTSWNTYIERCNELRGDHVNNPHKKIYDTGLFIIPFNIVRRPFIIIHNGYRIYEQQRLVTTCAFTRFTDHVVATRKIKYQNTCYYCNCRYSKSHNKTTKHTKNYQQFLSTVHTIYPLPIELWQSIMHFLYE
jgi:hypothetical protein